MFAPARWEGQSAGRNRHTMGTVELRSKRVVGDDRQTRRSRSSDGARISRGGVKETNQMVLGVGNDDAPSRVGAEVLGAIQIRCDLPRGDQSFDAAGGIHAAQRIAAALKDVDGSVRIRGYGARVDKGTL